MQIEICDDFDLEKIAISGQCFRVRRFDDGTFRFVTGESVIYIRKIEEHSFEVSCRVDEWEKLWAHYFDMRRCYADIRRRERDKHPFVRAAIDAGRGIRILRQNPWEMLITFIISQRKNIPAIAKSVEALCARYGSQADTERESMRAFPTPQKLGGASQDGLAACGLGYRVPYVEDAAERVLSGKTDLERMAECDDEELLLGLRKVRGVGKKVADCVALFAYGRTGCAPVDVWIERAIMEECGGQSPFFLFSENAGIIQQYIYYYKREKEQVTALDFS